MPTPARRKKVDERGPLFTKLGEEIWALFESKALPIPMRLRDTVDAIRALQSEAEEGSTKIKAPAPRTKKVEKKKA